MVTDNLLIFDCDYIAHRALYSHQLLEQGTTYGFIQAVRTITSDVFSQFTPCYCFDSPSDKLKRVEIYPNYKITRRNKRKTESFEDREKRIMYDREVKEIRKVILPNIGYRNIFYAKGFESDDLIAKICKTNPKSNIVIAASDKDFYQLLTPRISMFHPTTNKYYSLHDFKRDWDIEPKQWATVKAIAGCNSDDVDGLYRVGDVTACRYLRKLTSETVTKRINEFPHLERNLRLVDLPFDGTPVPKIRKDKASAKKWSQEMNRLGFESAVANYPTGLK